MLQLSEDKSTFVTPDLYCSAVYCRGRWGGVCCIWGFKKKRRAVPCLSCRRRHCLGCYLHRHHRRHSSGPSLVLAVVMRGLTVSVIWCSSSSHPSPSPLWPSLLLVTITGMKVWEITFLAPSQPLRSVSSPGKIIATVNPL